MSAFTRLPLGGSLRTSALHEPPVTAPLSRGGWAQRPAPCPSQRRRRPRSPLAPEGVASGQNDTYASSHMCVCVCMYECVCKYIYLRLYFYMYEYRCRHRHVHTMRYLYVYPANGLDALSVVSHVVWLVVPLLILF